MTDFHTTPEAIRIQKLIDAYEEASQHAYEEYLDAENMLEDLRAEYNLLEDQYED